MTDNNLINTALKKAMALCASREYCSEDIRVKLDSWDIKSKYADKIINKLIGENFINEKRYAEAFVKDKYNNNKWGKVKIASQLRIKKIASEVIDAALAMVDEDQYRQSIRGILASHRKFIKAKNQFDLKGKLLRYGLSKGFESHILYDILTETD